MGGKLGKFINRSLREVAYIKEVVLLQEGNGIGGSTGDWFDLLIFIYRGKTRAQ